MLVLGIEPESSAKAARAPNLRATSPAPRAYFLTLNGRTSRQLLSPGGAGLGPLGLHLSVPSTHTAFSPAIHQRATEARMQNQTGKEEGGARQADPGSRHREGLGGEGQRGRKRALGQRQPKAPGNSEDQFRVPCSLPRPKSGARQVTRVPTPRCSWPLGWRRPQIFLTYLLVARLSSPSRSKTEHDETEELGDCDAKTMTTTLREGLSSHLLHKHSGVCRGRLCSHTRTPTPQTSHSGNSDLRWRCIIAFCGRDTLYGRSPGAGGAFRGAPAGRLAV